MKRRFSYVLILAITLLILVIYTPPSSAVTFPKNYSGILHVTVSNSACGTTEADIHVDLELWEGGYISVSADKRYQLTCNFIPREWSFYGTHDNIGSFELSLKLDGAYLPAKVSGTFDDTQITGSGTGTSTIALSVTATLSLFAQSTSIDPTPKITLEPATYPEFQLSVLSGNGFTIKIRKEDGIKDSQGNLKLNLSTLVFSTDGMDNSMHFIDTAAQQGILSTTVDEKEIIFTILPDPKLFMLQQNLFNILVNGEHTIGLQICDTEGRCGSSVYTLYFGPFAMVGSVTDNRCSAEGYDLVLGKLVLGNMGHASVTTAVYIGMINMDYPDDFWCFTPSFTWRQLLLEPFIPLLTLPEAYFFSADYIPLNLAWAYSANPRPGNEGISYPFPGGLFQFVILAMDYYSGAVKGDSKDVLSCGDW